MSLVREVLRGIGAWTCARASLRSSNCSCVIRRRLLRCNVSPSASGVETLGESNILDVTIKNLRRRLGIGGEPRLIHTVHGAGYTLREGP